MLVELVKKLRRSENGIEIVYLLNFLFSCPAMRGSAYVDRACNVTEENRRIIRMFDVLRVRIRLEYYVS